MTRASTQRLHRRGKFKAPRNPFKLENLEPRLMLSAGTAAVVANLVAPTVPGQASTPATTPTPSTSTPGTPALSYSASDGQPGALQAAASAPALSATQAQLEAGFNAANGTLDLSQVNQSVTVLVHASGEVDVGTGTFAVSSDGSTVSAQGDQTNWVALSNVTKIVGGNQADTFVFENAAKAVTVEGNSGNDTLEVLGTNLNWSVTGNNTGNVGAISFNGVANLTAGVNAQDTFTVTATGSLSGVIDGGQGGNSDLVVEGGPASTISFDSLSQTSGMVVRDGAPAVQGNAPP